VGAVRGLTFAVEIGPSELGAAWWL